MSTAPWIVQIERLVLRDPAATRERAQEVVDALRRALESSEIPPARRDAGRAQSIPRIAIDAASDVDSVARALARELVMSMERSGGDSGA